MIWITQIPFCPFSAFLVAAIQYRHFDRFRPGYASGNMFYLKESEMIYREMVLESPGLGYTSGLSTSPNKTMHTQIYKETLHDKSTLLVIS